MPHPWLVARQIWALHVSQAADVTLRSGGPPTRQAIARAKRLALLGLLWTGVEGVAGVIAGLAAGSIALTGFGLDSAIEGAASAIVIWRFSGRRSLSATAEHRAQKAVAVSFFLLAPYLAAGSTFALATHSTPATSWVGVGVSIASLIAMPALARAEDRLGQQLGSPALVGEAAQNMLCAYIAASVLAGLLANTVLGWWWLDALVALGIAVLAAREGLEAWRTKACAQTAATQRGDTFGSGPNSNRLGSGPSACG